MAMAAARNGLLGVILGLAAANQVFVIIATVAGFGCLHPFWESLISASQHYTKSKRFNAARSLRF